MQVNRDIVKNQETIDLAAKKKLPEQAKVKPESSPAKVDEQPKNPIDKKND